MCNSTPSSHGQVPAEIFIDFEAHYRELYEIVLRYRDHEDLDSYLSILHAALQDVAQRMQEISRLKVLVARHHFDGKLRLRGKYRELIGTLRAVHGDLLECVYLYDGN